MPNQAFLQTRIDAIEARIVAYEAASLALASDGIQSYMLDTGQTIQKVTKLDLQWIESTLEKLMNQLVTLEARRNGTGVVIGKPQW